MKAIQLTTRTLLALALVLSLVAACGKKEREGWPAKPAGDTPLALTFVKLVGTGEDTEATMRIYNFTNKKVTMAGMKLHYLDAAGKEIGSFPWSVSKGGGLVEPNGTTEEDMGFGIPAGTKSVTAEVTDVGFADQTEWSAKPTPSASR